MNSTKWPSLTEFAKYLGRESICRVEETDKGIHISWIDNSPEALKRQEALRRKEAQEQGDEELEQRMIREQIRRAQANTEAQDNRKEDDQEDRGLKRQEGEKIKLSFNAKTPSKPEGPTDSVTTASSKQPASEATQEPGSPEKSEYVPTKPGGFGGVSMKMGGKTPAKNVFAQAKRNALSSGPKKPSAFEQPKKMSEAERIMKEEMEKKRPRETAGFGMPAGKKQRSH
jgi:DNA/RNA-binding protein KIN17